MIRNYKIFYERIKKIHDLMNEHRNISTKYLKENIKNIKDLKTKKEIDNRYEKCRKLYNNIIILIKTKKHESIVNKEIEELEKEIEKFENFIFINLLSKN